MNPKSPREAEDDRLLAERAAEWVNVLKSANATERAEFADWLAASPRHIEEFLMTTALDRELDRLPLKENATLQAMLARASNPVVQLRPPVAPPNRESVNPMKSGSRALLRTRWVAGFAALLAAVTVLVWQLNARGQLYATAVGEQRAVVLPDGSQMVLTARTETRVRFSDSGRNIELLEGEALFKVAKDSGRPFLVRSGGSVIQAIGTQFNVLRRPSGTTVSVLEGAVSVKGEPATLRAGDEVRIAPDGRIDKRARVNKIMVATWRQQRLIFRADTLLDIAAEFNRYNRVPQLVVEGDAESTPRYTGVFDADDPRSLLAFLRDDPQITLEERGDELVIRPR